MERFIEHAAAVEPGRYDMTIKESIVFRNMASQMDLCEVLSIAFKYGFLKGQRAEKAQNKKNRPGSANTETAKAHS